MTETQILDSSSYHRILVVENSAADCSSIRRLFATAKPGSYRLDWAATAKDALTAISQGEHALCFLDSQLGEEECLALLREVRTRELCTPIVLFTEAEADELRLRALSLGAVDCLAKSELSPGLLQRVISHALERTRYIAENQRLLEEVHREEALRQHAENALLRSEEQLRAIFNAAPDFVTVIDPDGIILDINAAAVATLGAATREEVVGRSVYAFVAPEYHAIITATDCAVHRGESVSTEFEVVSRNGRRYEVECCTVPLWRQDLQATCALAIARDVTSQRRAVAALREREARYRLQAQLLNAVGQAVIATRPDGKIFYWNQAAQEIYGWPAAEVMGRDILEVAPTESSLEQAREIMAQLARGGDWSGEFSVRRRNGEIFPVWVANTPLLDEEGRLAGIIGTSHDLTKQKQAEAALREQESQYRRLAEANILGVFSWQSDGKVSHANEVFLQMTRYSRDDLAQGAVNWRSLTPPEYRPRDEQALLELFERGAIAPYEKEYRRKDGSRLPVIVVATCLEGEADQGIAYVLDLTKQREAERANEETLSILRAVTEGTTDAVFAKDQHGRYLMINSAGARFVGLTVAEIIGRNDVELFSADTVSQILESDQRVLNTGETFTTEEAITASGITRTYLATKGPFRDTSGEIIGTIGISRDITQRKSDEQALRESEARFRAMAESFPHGLYLTTPEGRTLYANPEAYRLAALETPGTTFFEWEEAVHPEDRKRVVAEWNTALTNGGCFNCVHRFLQPGGKTVWVHSHTAPVWVGGALLGYVGMLEDVTEIRHLEEQLQQAQKMEAIGRLAGGIAHDFNNLLAVINGYSEIVQMHLPEGSALSEHLGEVRKAGERAAGLTRQLLAFSRKQVLAPKVLDPNQLIIEVEKLLSRLIGEDIRLETELLPDVGKVFADPGQLEQVLMNLAINARDAMPEGGQLRLSTRKVAPQDPDFPFPDDLLPIDYVMMEVQDSGGGMTPEVRARIFEPFFTTKGLGEGTGLGLAVVHGIVAQSGGQIQVDSEPGKGTTFRIFFPHFEAQVPNEEQDTSLPELPRGTETVLLVEDDEAVRRLTSLMLREAGYAVLEASCAEAALSTAAHHSGPIHLLATDIVLPGKGGRHLAQEMQAHNPALPVLYLTGYTDDAVVRHGVLVDEVDILQKPYSTEDLIRKVRAVLDSARDARASRGRFPASSTTAA